MSTIRTFTLALFTTTIAMGAMAQTPAAPSASMPMAGATMPRDCAQPMARHDHGAERGMPTPKAVSAPCTPAAAAAPAAPAASATRNKPGHDHGKFHKNA